MDDIVEVMRVALRARCFSEEEFSDADVACVIQETRAASVVAGSHPTGKRMNE